MVHPLPPSHLLTREHSHKPIKQTQDTRTTYTTRASAFGGWNNDGFLLGLRHESDPAVTIELFVLGSKWLMIHSTTLHAGGRWPARCSWSGGTKGRKGRQGMETTSHCCLKPTSAGYLFLFMQRLSGCSGCSLDFHTWAASRSTPHGSPLVIHNAEILILSRAVSSPDHFAFLFYK